MEILVQNQLNKEGIVIDKIATITKIISTPQTSTYSRTELVEQKKKMENKIAKLQEELSELNHIIAECDK